MAGRDWQVNKRRAKKATRNGAKNLKISPERKWNEAMEGTNNSKVWG